MGLTLHTRVFMRTARGSLTPFSRAFTSGMPEPPATGSTSTAKDATTAIPVEIAVTTKHAITWFTSPDLSDRAHSDIVMSEPP